MITAVSLNTSIDEFWVIERFSLDDTMRSKKITRRAGGKPVNVATIANALGEKALVHAVVAGDSGKLFLELARQNKFRVRHFWLKKGNTRTNLVISEPVSGKLIRVSGESPHITSSETRQFFEGIKNKKGERVVISGAMPKGFRWEDAKSYFEKASKDGIKIFLDTDDAKIPKNIFESIHCLKPNQYEAERFCGYKINSLKSAAAACLYYRKRGVKNVLLSLGAKGAVFLFKNGVCRFAKAPKVKLRSPIGAGDVLLAGFVVGLNRGKDLESAVRFGIACAASSVSNEPGKFVNPKNVRSFERRIKLSTIN